MRYVIEKEIFLRKVDFKKFLTNNQSTIQEAIYEVAPDDQTIINKGPIVHQGNTQDNWANRFGQWGYTFEAYVHVDKYQDKENFEKSF